MRGEDHHGVNVPGDEKGSPPHARGRLAHEVVEEIGQRITPACAGKTRDRSPCYNYRSDHPRMRGEDLNPTSDRWTSLWITPACAGKTDDPDVHLYMGKDHPRMRGED